MEKLDLKPKKREDKKTEGNKMPENVARKYEAVVVPKVLIFPKKGVRIDMRTMTLQEADAIHDYSPGTYLKLKKESAEEASKKL